LEEFFTIPSFSHGARGYGCGGVDIMSINHFLPLSYRFDDPSHGFGFELFGAIDPFAQS
jgi:hypothetical protein